MEKIFSIKSDLDILMINKKLISDPSVSSIIKHTDAIVNMLDSSCTATPAKEK